MKTFYINLLHFFCLLFIAQQCIAMELETEPKQEELLPKEPTFKYDQARGVFTKQPLSCMHFASEQVARNFLAVGTYINGETIDALETEIGNQFQPAPTDLHPLVSQQIFLQCYENGWNVNYIKSKSSGNNKPYYPYINYDATETKLVIRKNQETVSQELTFEQKIRSSILSPNNQLLTIAFQDGSIQFFHNDAEKWEKVELGENDKSIKMQSPLTFLNNMNWISFLSNTIYIWEEHDGKIKCVTQKPIVGTIKKVITASPEENKFFIITEENKIYSCTRIDKEWFFEYLKTEALKNIDRIKRSSDNRYYAGYVYPQLTPTEQDSIKAQYPQLNPCCIDRFDKMLIWENRKGKMELIKSIELIKTNSPKEDNILWLLQFENGIASFRRLVGFQFSRNLLTVRGLSINCNNGNILAKGSKFSWRPSQFDDALALLDTNPPLPAILASIALANSRNAEQLQALKGSKTVQDLPEKYKKQIDEKIQKRLKRLED